MTLQSQCFRRPIFISPLFVTGQTCCALIQWTLGLLYFPRWFVVRFTGPDCIGPVLRDYPAGIDRTGHAHATSQGSGVIRSVWLVNSAELRTRWRRTCTRAWSPLSRVDDGRLRKRNRSGSSLLARGQSHAKLPTAGEQLQAQAQKISAGPDLTTLTVQVYPVGVPSCVSVPGF